MKLAYSMSTGFVDFPGKYAATIYLTGCNLRCPYCYNMQVVNGEPTLEYDDILEYLIRMKKIFPKFYVVISGGEPTINKDFEYVVEDLKRNNFKLGIHTNGIKLPKFENVFDGVILSLKSISDGIPCMLKTQYYTIMKDAMKYYDKCDYKEIRVVNIENNNDWYNSMLNIIKPEESGWLIRKVNNYLEGN